MKKIAASVTVAILIIAWEPAPTTAQETSAVTDTSTAESNVESIAHLPNENETGLRVFVDCRSGYCDFDHFRREIPFVNYMRNRQDAQVHVLVTTRSNGSGTEFSFSFIGLEEFSGMDDEFPFYSSHTDTEDVVRSHLTRLLKLGLMRYVVRTANSDRFDVSYDSPDTTEMESEPEHDPWNYWIFQARLGGNLSGESLQQYFSGNGSLSANRTTETWKIGISVDGWYSQDEFEFSDGTKFVSVSRDNGARFSLVRSLGDHWGAMTRVQGRSSTFRNYDLDFEAGVGVEYNLFPYSESTRRSLTFMYAPFIKVFEYKEETIFEKTSETRGFHRFEVEYSLQQPFGSIYTSLAMSSFVPDFDQHRINLYSSLNLSLVRGLDLSLWGSVSRTKDQIYLPRSEASDEEVLLRRRALGTDYNYWGGFGLSYTFGSIYNNVVNPRF